MRNVVINNFLRDVIKMSMIITAAIVIMLLTSVTCHAVENENPSVAVTDQISVLSPADTSEVTPQAAETTTPQTGASSQDTAPLSDTSTSADNTAEAPADTSEVTAQDPETTTPQTETSSQDTAPSTESTPVTEQPVKAASSATVQTSQVGIVYRTGANVGLRVRDKPSLSGSTVLTRIYDGTKVEVISKQLTDILWYQIRYGSITGWASADYITLNGTVSNDKVIWDFLISKGAGEYAAAGIMGNLYAESELWSDNLEGTYETSLGLSDSAYTYKVDNGTYNNFVYDKAGYGIAQWTYWSRKQALLDYAKKTSRSIGDLNMQLEFLWNEICTSYANVLSVMKKATTVRAASDAFMTGFERPADTSETAKAKRAAYGQKYYDLYASGNTGGGGSETQTVSFTGGRFYRSGKLLTSQWVDYNGNRYFVNKSGYPYKNRIITFGPSVSYYMTSDGSMALDSINTYQGSKYYSEGGASETPGKIRRNARVEFNGKKYFASPTGAFYHDRFITFGGMNKNYMSSDCSVATGVFRTASGDLYYQATYATYVRVTAGWINYSDKKYFAASGGKLYHDRFITFGGTNKVYMTSDGSRATGIFKTASGEYYFHGPSATYVRITAGWITYNGKKYYAAAGGALYHDRFIYFSKVCYKMQSDASVYIGTFTYGNKKITTNSDGSFSRALIG